MLSDSLFVAIVCSMGSSLIMVAALVLGKVINFLSRDHTDHETKEELKFPHNQPKSHIQLMHSYDIVFFGDFNGHSFKYGLN